MDNGQVALVSGGNRGIGLEVCRQLAERSYTVVMGSRDDKQGRAAAAGLPYGVIVRQLDVADPESVERLSRSIEEEFGRLDILVNNAGITGFENGPVPHDPEHASLADWHAVHRTNLDGVFLGCRHAIRAMRQAGRGSIINISSRSGMVGIPGAAAYASSKAAVRNHTRTVALYCAEQGLDIRCNAVFPAAILTPMWEPLLGDGPDREQRMREFVRAVPLGRFGTPEEVAAIVAYLASDESGYTTGAEFVLDGGLLAGAAAPPSRAPIE
jgi:NAD(P)-dependent dehydrogenase (short-subunit alcohol dehydrogenase family)